MYRRSVSFGGIYNNKLQDNLLYKKLPLNPAQGLVSAKSESSIVTKKQLETRKHACQLPLKGESSTRQNTMVESSDEEDEDEGIVVRIDSPSKIVFRNDL